MSLRRRTALLTGAVMVLGVCLVLLVARQLTATALVTSLDEDLADLATVATRLTAAGGAGPGASLNELRQMPRAGSGMPRRGPGAVLIDGPVQVLAADGTVSRPAVVGLPASGTQPAPQRLPVTAAAAAVARGERSQDLGTVTVDGDRLRVLTTPLAGGGAVQLARSLAEVDAALARLTLWLLLLGAVVCVAAMGVAVAVAGRVVRPVETLTEAAEHVALTQRLDTRIAPQGQDELARLGHSFDQMLERLEQARVAQSQLVADASHELRTPLTSLRTNIDLLRSGVALPAEDHQQLLEDLGGQLVEFGVLVDDLVELARGEQPPASRGPVDLAVLAGQVVQAAQRDHRTATFHLDVGAPAVTLGDADRLARALRNVVDNAVVHGGGQVDIEVARDADRVRIRVRDHGPGIADDDLPRVFGRFYRAPAARGRTGSGLGLAIVEQAARVHGGRASVHNDPEGGTVVTLDLPASGPAQVQDRC